MILDERFLHTHPATLKWWTQRSKCEECAHSRASPDHHGLVCRGSPRVGRGAYPLYCIDARDEKQRCGPDAKLFKEK